MDYELLKGNVSDLAALFSMVRLDAAIDCWPRIGSAFSSIIILAVLS
jgi:hypothetical protein